MKMKTALITLIILMLFTACSTGKKVTRVNQKEEIHTISNSDTSTNIQNKSSVNEDISFNLTVTEISKGSSIEEKIKAVESATGVRLSEDQKDAIKESAKKSKLKKRDKDNQNTVITTFSLNYNKTTSDSTETNLQATKSENIDSKANHDLQLSETIKQGGKFKTILIWIFLCLAVVAFIIIKIKGIPFKSIPQKIISFLKK